MRGEQVRVSERGQRVARIEIFHNVNRDASFGLNTLFTREGKGLAQTPDEMHELVRVFEYEMAWTDDQASVQPLLNDAFETFNVGSDELAAQYRARGLRSLSVGDVVTVDGVPYACASVGWDPVSRYDLRILSASEAEKVVRDRFDFGPDGELCVTVPLAD